VSARFTASPPPRPALTPSRRRHIHGELIGLGQPLPEPRPPVGVRISSIVGISVALWTAIYFAAQLLRPIVAGWIL
jgi:hypothetical protein